AIRSAVFDSTLSYTDPAAVVPSFALAVMAVNLCALSFCLFVVCAGLASYIVTLLSGGVRGGPRTRREWLTALPLFVLTGGAFDLAGSEPLMSTAYRILFGCAVLLFTLRLHTQGRARRPLATPGRFLLALGLSGLFLYPLLERHGIQRDRDRVELLAVKLTRPVDGWLSSVVTEALRRFGEEDAVRILEQGRAGEITQLAFSRWAKSVAGSEGYDCRFLVRDPDGAVLSSFALGPEGYFRDHPLLARVPPQPEPVRIHEIGAGIGAARLYSGCVPIRGAAGGLVGWGVVVVAAGQRSLFRGDVPAVLRSVAGRDLEPVSRTVTVSEFREGRLFATDDPALSLRRVLPEGLPRELDASPEGSVWRTETVGGDPRETLYLRRPESRDQVLVLSMAASGCGWTLFGVVRTAVYYLMAVLLLLAGWLVWRHLARIPYRLSFRDRLLGALLFTALVPVVILAIHGRAAVRDRSLEAMADRLQREAAVIASWLVPPGEEELPPLESRISGPLAEKMAGELGTDFGVFTGGRLLAGSRPELYATGILDTRMPGSAYNAIVIEGRRFHLETEQAGMFRYAVGYAPLAGPGNRLLGVVSVPTLYRQEEIDREVSQQHALLFGVYGLVVLATVGIATTFANRIASPIRRLTLATRAVAGGNLDIRMDIPRKEAEIGELAESFETMTRELKRGREELRRAERELAWKEMARQVAHEIKNPLTPMKLSVQHLRQVYRDGAADFARVLEEVSDLMIGQIEALGRIASEFSHFARMPARRPGLCDVNEALKASVHLFEQEGEVLFDLRLAEGLPPVEADPEELRRAFINIIRNGIQAMNNAGRMTVSTDREADGVCIRIRDSGPGMSPEARAKLFEPNFSTKTDGMGLGLAIVKRTVDDLHGTILLENPPGGGMLASITLPGASPGV
ncbi:MAG: ATP-binding protein, partial [Bacteroidota bacterium]